MKMRRSKLYMDTVVDIQVISKRKKSEEEAQAQINRAFEAFRKVEQACSRFSPDSELMKACRQIHTPVPVSPLLFEPLKFALEMAKWTDGVFDPTVGAVMEAHGFNRHYLTGQVMESSTGEPVTYQDVVLNERECTLLLRKPMVIDLGAVAKGFAIDLAAHELQEFDGFVVNAGGDLFAGGLDERGHPWEIGIRHPERKGQIIYTIEVTNEAVCTSGSYERQSATRPGIHHIVHPYTKQSPNDWLSCTVVAPYGMLADAFSTASMLLGKGHGETMMDQAGLQGILIASDLQIVTIGGI